MAECLKLGGMICPLYETIGYATISGLPGDFVYYLYDGFDGVFYFVTINAGTFGEEWAYDAMGSPSTYDAFCCF